MALMLRPSHILGHGTRTFVDVVTSCVVEGSPCGMRKVIRLISFAYSDIPQHRVMAPGFMYDRLDLVVIQKRPESRSRISHIF